VLLDLTASGMNVKATGFGRVKMGHATGARGDRGPRSVAPMFGTDLPSLRAVRPFKPTDVGLLPQVRGNDLARRPLRDDAQAFHS
jgi:hypothetical protein